MPTNRRDLTTYAYRKARARFLARWNTCHICGHPHADVIDHVDPHRPRADQNNWAPAHGIRGCARCGRKCNNEKSNRPLAEIAFVKSRDWYSK